MRRLIKSANRRAVEFSGKLSITGLSDSEIEQMQEDLTLENPAYKKALRYSKYSRVSISPYLMYYKVLKNNLIEVPLGYSSIFDMSKFSIKDRRVFPEVSVPPFLLDLREDQKSAAENYIEKNKDPYHLYGCIQMPTGKGKSILGLYLAHHYKTRTLIVVHKDDLVTGWKKDIKLCFGGKVKEGLIKAKSKKIGTFLTIATIQTLNKLSQEELYKLYSHFGFVILDEMHHCPANTFGIISNFNSRYRLGLTATPERADGLGKVMSFYFGDFAFAIKSSKGDSDILNVEIKRCNLPLHFEPRVRKDKSGYKLVTSDPLDKDIPITNIPYEQRPRVPYTYTDDYVIRSCASRYVEDILNEHSKGRSCIVFLSQKNHVRLIRDLLIERGVPESKVLTYYGDNSTKVNNKVLEIAEQVRDTITLTTYSKSTEGTNVRQWEVEFLLSSINSGKNVEQAIGRIRRVKEGKLSTVLVYDYRYPYVYSFNRHGNTRDLRYKKMSIGVPPYTDNNKLFSRGF